MPEYLETTFDKFTFKVAADRSYCPDGIWLQDLGEGRVRVGVTDFVQQHSGDVAFASVKARNRVEARTRRALEAAQKYSPVANSVKSEIDVEPQIIIESEQVPAR